MDFPPGAAHASRMVSPGFGSSILTACWVAGSWMYMYPWSIHSCLGRFSEW